MNTDVNTTVAIASSIFGLLLTILTGFFMQVHKERDEKIAEVKHQVVNNLVELAIIFLGLAMFFLPLSFDIHKDPKSFYPYSFCFLTLYLLLTINIIMLVKDRKKKPKEEQEERETA